MIFYHLSISGWAISVTSHLRRIIPRRSTNKGSHFAKTWFDSSCFGALIWFKSYSVLQKQVHELLLPKDMLSLLFGQISRLLWLLDHWSGPIRPCHLLRGYLLLNRLRSNMTLLNYTVMPAFEEVVYFEIGSKQVAHCVIPSLLHFFLFLFFKLIKYLTWHVATCIFSYSCRHLVLILNRNAFAYADLSEFNSWQWFWKVYKFHNMHWYSLRCLRF